MELPLLDIILLFIVSYMLGVATGLLICCNYKDKIMKSKSSENLKQFNHQNLVYPPTAQVSPVIQASAPPAELNQPNPLKLTIN